MSKIKLKRSSPHVDMTPMVDLFALLLTFFMLTTTFRPNEAAVIDTPFSVSEKTAPDMNLITFYVDKKNKVYFDMNNDGKKMFNGKEIPDSSTHYRRAFIEKLAEQAQIKLTPKEIKSFETAGSLGLPFKNLKAWLDVKEPKDRDKLNEGIPYDSTDNQLALWVRLARVANQSADVAIKGDGEADYKTVKKVMDVLLENNVQKFNLVTNLRKEKN